MTTRAATPEAKIAALTSAICTRCISVRSSRISICGEARAARQHARERGGDGQLHHQDHQVLLEHARSWALAIIIME